VQAWTAALLQIALMAADGLTNREVGQRLYLSHRTIGSHLHRLFPKHGIASRAQLRTALQPADSATLPTQRRSD
jgi:DNA-binding NarL/FixJ family response regulator